jgi:hypothetical protein
LEALKVASGLANPGHIAEDDSEFVVAEALPAELFIFSDGRFAPVTGFSLGNLEPHFVSIGEPDAGNVGITAFSVRRSEASPELFQAFARLENFGTEEVDVSVELFLDDRPEPINADELTIGAGEAGPVAFDLGAIESGVLMLRVSTADHLSVDDEAWVVVSPPRHVSVLLITPSNEPLEFAVQTDLVKEIAEVVIKSPEFLKEKTYRAEAVGGAYDLVIYDRCRPEKMPQANTLFIGSLPPEGGWSAKPKVDLPQIIDVEAAHPLMQWIELGDVSLLEGAPLERPPGSSVLIDADVGPMCVVAPRERFEDAVLGFAIIDEVAGEGDGTERYFGTDWPSRKSFPVFVLNVIDYLGGSRNVLDSGSVQPGKPVAVEGPTRKGRLHVVTPSKKRAGLQEGKAGKFSFSGTAELGVYEVQADQKAFRRFAVNLFDAAESNIQSQPEPSIKIGYVEIAGQPGWEVARREAWKWLLLLGLVVLLLEWYIYNRRVYL